MTEVLLLLLLMVKSFAILVQSLERQQAHKLHELRLRTLLRFHPDATILLQVCMQLNLMLRMCRSAAASHALLRRLLTSAMDPPPL
jgi:hypothetical protein